MYFCVTEEMSENPRSMNQPLTVIIWDKVSRRQHWQMQKRGTKITGRNDRRVEASSRGNTET
jgi:hypothetical protein